MTKPADAPEWAEDKDFEIDFGDDHYGRFMSSGGEGITNSRTGEPVPFIAKAGILLTHRQPAAPSGWCQGYAPFKLGGDARGWDVHSLDPLDISPSVLCRVDFGNGHYCNDHGFIRLGRWVRA